MSTVNIADEVATLSTRLNYLERKSRADDEMIDLLRKQNDELSQDLTDATHDFNIDLFKMQVERDDALSKASEVRALIESIGGLALNGVRKMKGDEVPKMPQAKHLQNGASANLLPDVRPESPLPPKPSPVRHFA